MIWTLEKIAPFDRCLEIVAEAGYQGVELTGQWRKWTPADTQRYQAKMHSLGLVVDVLSAVRVGFADPNSGPAFQAAIAEQITFCKQFQTPQINLRSGNVIEGVDRSVQHAAAIENLKHAADLAAAANIEILIEPVRRARSAEGISHHGHRRDLRSCVQWEARR